MSAFVTFNTTKGHDIALKMIASEKSFFGSRKTNNDQEIFDCNPTIKQAPDPSNIIWENYSISFNRKLFNQILIGLILIIIYFVILTLFTLNKRTANKFFNIFPLETSCSCIASVYENKNGTIDDFSNWAKYAKFDKKNALYSHGDGQY